MQEIAQQIAKSLLEAQAVKISMNPPFTWVSGIKSPIYCDNRLLIAYPEIRKQIVDGFKSLIEEQKLEFDYIAGTATAGIPWAAFLAYEMQKPMVYVRPEPKAHGAGKQVEGFIPKGQKVLLIEDLISTGGSSLKVAQVLKNETEATVIAILAIVNYQLDKANKAFAESGMKYESLTNFAVLTENARQMGAIDNLETVLAFQKDPENWYQNNFANHG